jgi:hypothetical protein
VSYRDCEAQYRHLSSVQLLANPVSLVARQKILLDRCRTCVVVLRRGWRCEAAKFGAMASRRSQRATCDGNVEGLKKTADGDGWVSSSADRQAELSLTFRRKHYHH